MRIAASSTIYPSRIITNDDICRFVLEYSSGLQKNALAKLIVVLERYLEGLGAKTRHWLAGHEKPIHLIKQAYLTALEQSGTDANAIDCLIYCGVDRALLEPANAALISFELGLTEVRAFDIAHACLGWFTALQVAGDRADLHGETSLIVSSEFPMTYGGVAFPQNFELSDLRADEGKLASFVLGEAASVTVVAPGGRPLNFVQRSDNEGFDASYVRLRSAERYLSNPTNPFAAAELTFYSNPSELTKHGMRIGYEVFEKLGFSRSADPVVVPHTISSKLLDFLRARYWAEMDIIDLFPEVGNIGTSSLPAGFARYQQERAAGSRGPDQPIIGWMVAAGMSAVAFQFPFGDI